MILALCHIEYTLFFYQFAFHVTSLKILAFAYIEIVIFKNRVNDINIFFSFIFLD